MVMGTDCLQADLAWVRRLLRFLLEDEAVRSPEAAAGLLALAESRGKLLRPRLVLMGARCALGEPATPSENSQELLREPQAELENLRQKLSSAGSLLFSQGAPELEAWGKKRPFPGALENRYYLLACALEILHLATLTHDDVVDDASLRRGMPSAKTQLGNHGAVLLGDLLLTMCFTLVNEAASRPTARLLSGMVRLIVRSEFAQAGRRENLKELLRRPERRVYLRVIGGKTALLFALSLASGTVEAGAPRKLQEELGWAGYYLGLAFQIEDDILDFTADPQALGKPLGQDLREGQITLPLIEALTMPGADTTLKEEIIGLALDFSSGREEAFPVLVEKLETLGAFEAAEAAAGGFLKRAEKHLRRASELCGGTPAAKQLLELPALMSGRKW